MRYIGDDGLLDALGLMKGNATTVKTRAVMSALFAMASLAIFALPACSDLDLRGQPFFDGGPHQEIIPSEEGSYEEEFQRVLNEYLSRQDLPEEDIFSSLELAREANADVCAWIFVPGTNVNLPICQRESDRYYYMRHDVDGITVAFGTPFVEKGNATDFTDPVTVVYGHSLVDADLLFTQLHRFEDDEFAQEHRTFLIYLPDKVLTYRILFSGFVGSTSILSELGEYDLDRYQTHFDEFAGQAGVLDASSDRIVHLSTCSVPPENSNRYVITGVLEREQLL